MGGGDSGFILSLMGEGESKEWCLIFPRMSVESLYAVSIAMGGHIYSRL